MGKSLELRTKFAAPESILASPNSRASPISATTNYTMGRHSRRFSTRGFSDELSVPAAKLSGSPSDRNQLCVARRALGGQSGDLRGVDQARQMRGLNLHLGHLAAGYSGALAIRDNCCPIRAMIEFEIQMSSSVDRISES